MLGPWGAAAVLFGAVCLFCLSPAWGLRLSVPLGARRSVGTRLFATEAEPVDVIASQDEFDRATKGSASGVVAVVDFQKSGCKPCIRVAPAFEALARKHYGQDRVKFFKVDADAAAESLRILKSEGIRSVPTFQIWQHGKKVDSIQGAHVDEVEECVQGLLTVQDKQQQQQQQ